MNRFLLTLGCALASTCLSSCTHPFHKWEMNRAQQIYEKQQLQVDLSTDARYGFLLIRSLPPSQQMLVDNYSIQIDDFEPIIFFKHSDLEILLDEGEHSFTVKAPSFGRPASEKFKISMGERKVYKYTGPYWVWSAGKLEEKTD